MLSIEAFRRVMTPALQVELPMASLTASNPDLAVGEECRKANLDMAVGEGQNIVGGDGGHVEGPPSTEYPHHDIVGV
jgi:hypothetical protein